MDARRNPIPPWARAIERAGAALHGFYVRRAIHLIAILSLLFVLGAVLAPALTASGCPLAGSVLHRFYRPFCHQIPSRCLSVRGVPAALCARCLAIETPVALALAFFAVLETVVEKKAARIRPISRLGFALLISPALLEYLVESLGASRGNMAIRVVTGILAGCAISGRVIPFLCARLREARNEYARAQSTPGASQSARTRETGRRRSTNGQDCLILSTREILEVSHDGRRS